MQKSSTDDKLSNHFFEKVRIGKSEENAKEEISDSSEINVTNSLSTDIHLMEMQAI